mmetsp:Transcript_22397/g.34650  ORF Transcript_22397/g.34650 Transcript_22397/m.34650 type:complete len:208 (+) Transcript_22397:521-1144(+)
MGMPMAAAVAAAASSHAGSSTPSRTASSAPGSPARQPSSSAPAAPSAWASPAAVVGPASSPWTGRPPLQKLIPSLPSDLAGGRGGLPPLPPRERIFIPARSVPEGTRMVEGAAVSSRSTPVRRDSTFLPSLLPWEQSTTERSSQLPASRCSSVRVSSVCVSPNCPKRWRRKEECVTTAMHFSGRWLSHSRNRTARSQQCSSLSRSSE